MQLNWVRELQKVVLEDLLTKSDQESQSPKGRWVVVTSLSTRGTTRTRFHPKIKFRFYSLKVGVKPLRRPKERIRDRRHVDRFVFFLR